jgi:cyanophycinase
VAGGGALGPEIWERFVELAGGPEARIVVIPTAGTDEIFPEDWSGFTPIRSAGASAIRVLHTRDREEADHPEFASLLQWATGVWIPGGRQWRLVDAYLHTRVHDELWALLDRNGVIGGTSAGASIQADFLVRGDPSTNQIMVADGYLEGFGFLVNTAIDQHLLARAVALHLGGGRMHPQKLAAQAIVFIPGIHQLQLPRLAVQVDVQRALGASSHGGIRRVRE